MKLTIAYIPEEQEQAAAAMAALRQVLPGVRVHESERHPPFKHTYLTTRKSGKTSDFNEKH